MNSEFVHLHVHSVYSLLDGTCRLAALAEQALKLSMTALAITDCGALHGAREWRDTAIAAGIKPIIGCELSIVESSGVQRPTRTAERARRLTVLAETTTGYRNLMKIVSASHWNGFHRVPLIEERFLATHREGLIVMSGCVDGELPARLLSGDVDGAKATLLRMVETFGKDHFFVELNDHGTVDERRVNRLLVQLARDHEVALVATNDVHYVNKEDAMLHDVLRAIQAGETMNDSHRPRLPSDEYYLKSAQEMNALFRYVPEAIANTVRIAERCNVEWDEGKVYLPVYPLPRETDAAAYLSSMAEQGLASRYPAPTQEALARLHYELNVIKQIGFSDYFLVVWDFVRFARERGIAVGPGRGSAAASLVAYSLKITDVDPLQYGLLFERFLNPHRVSWPDIDIDFEDERRQEVIRYVIDRYGTDRVAQIGTFGTLAARAAIRDVGKVLEVPTAKIDAVAKLIPGVPGMTIARALDEHDELRQTVAHDAAIRRMIEVAQALEGVPRHTSVHAAGVVIAPKPLVEFVPLMAGADGGNVTQFDMESVEASGLVKIDFLGLRTLTLLRQTLAFIEKSRGIRIELSNLEMTDEATFTLLCRGDTNGCFQLESRGVKQMLRELRPTTFEDIIAVVSLYRPGPMDHIDTFIKAKHGQVAVRYPHDDLQPILEDTYGVIVYQEQIMQIASQMAGFSLGQADLLRRAVGKKKRDVLDEQRAVFVAGCTQKGYAAAIADEVYDLIVQFADYGFNRAHAAAYAVLAYQTSYLKANFAPEFMAALLSNVIHAPHKVAEYVNDCRRMGVAVMQPDVNKSEESFSVEAGCIRFGLAAIKYVGVSAVQSILQAREKGPFRSLMDFAERVDSRHCNKKTLESLIRAGAMDEIVTTRRAVLEQLDLYVEGGPRAGRRDSANQLSLFPAESTMPDRVDGVVDADEFSHNERLAMERELLGLYVSAHPLTPYQAEMERHATHQVVDLAETADGSRVTMAGMVKKYKEITTKNGGRMAFVELEDMTGMIEVVLFPKVWETVNGLMHDETVFVVTGRVQTTEEDCKLIADAVHPAKRSHPAKPNAAGDNLTLLLRIESGQQRPNMLNELQAVLRQFKGTASVILYYVDDRLAKQLSDRYAVSISDELLLRLRTLMGDSNVVVREKR